MLTAFISTSPGLTCPGLLAPDRHDAGSRRVGSRVHGRSEDRGYVVPQASDVAVADDARWGSRPMAEHRVMSEDLLGVTHYRSRRCYDSQPNCQKPNGTRSRRAARLYSTSRQRAKSTAGTERIGHGGATHQTANLCSKLNCASLPRPQGRRRRALFQQPDLENHWVPMRNRALPSVMAFVAQATQPAGALLRDRQAAA